MDRIDLLPAVLALIPPAEIPIINIACPASGT